MVCWSIAQWRIWYTDSVWCYFYWDEIWKMYFENCPEFLVLSKLRSAWFLHLKKSIGVINGIGRWWLGKFGVIWWGHGHHWNCTFQDVDGLTFSLVTDVADFKSVKIRVFGDGLSDHLKYLKLCYDCGKLKSFCSCDTHMTVPDEEIDSKSGNWNVWPRVIN